MAMLLCTILEWGHCPHSCQRMGTIAPTTPMVPLPLLSYYHNHLIINLLATYQSARFLFLLRQQWLKGFIIIPATIQLSPQNHASIYNLNGLQDTPPPSRAQPPDFISDAVTEAADWKDNIQEVGGHRTVSLFVVVK